METKVEENSDDSKVSSKSMSKSQVDADINALIRSLMEETQQISELVEMEKSYTTELTSQFKQIILGLNASYHIKPESISKNDSSISDVVLTPQGVVCVFSHSGSVVSRNLEALQSEVLLRILMEVIPEVKVLLNERRQKLNGRVMSLERLSKELRKVPVMPTGRARPSSPEQGTEARRERSSSGGDALRSAIDGK